MTASSASAQDLQHWTLTHDLRIGGLSAENHGLTYVSDVEVDAQGRVYVAQSQEKTIRVYDDTGTFLRAIGRGGAGPGEFRRVDGLGIAAGGVLALDQASNRLTMFSRDGKFIRQWSAPRYDYPPGSYETAPRTALKDGSLVVIPVYRSQQDSEPARVPILVFDSAGGFRSSAGTLSVGDRSVRAQSGRLVAVMPQPVSTHTLWGIARDAPAVLLVNRSIGENADEQSRFEVVKISAASGDTLFSRAYRVPTQPIPAETIERERDREIDQTTASRPFPRTIIAELYRNGWQFPPFQAPVDRVVGSEDGTVWLRRGSFGQMESTWWVLDRSGTLIASLTAPTDLNVLRISGTHVWGTQRGQFDQFHVVRLAIGRTE